MFSSLKALRSALQRQPTLLDTSPQVVVHGQLYKVDHIARQVTPASFEESKRATFAGNLGHFFHAGSGQTAEQLQHLLFSPRDSTGDSSEPTPMALSHSQQYGSVPNLSTPPHPLEQQWTNTTEVDALDGMQDAALTLNLPIPPTSEDVLLGLDAVDGYENQGIPREYLKKTQQVANQMDMVLAIRPVEYICRTLIEEGVASKGLDIKGKSSNWGPMAGYIPFDQAFSKLASIANPHSRQSQIAKANALNAKAVQQGIEITQLTLSPARWQELCQLGLITNVTDIAHSSHTVRAVVFQSAPKGQPPQRFQGVQQGDGHWLIFTSQDKPLEVIPKTADFDLFFAFTHMERLELATLDKQKPFDARLGIYSDRVYDLINRLNAAYDRGPGKEMVHHGTDVFNPATDMGSNLPATVFIPRQMLPMGVYSDSPLLIRTPGELVRLFRTMRDNNIRIESNILWLNLHQIVREPFELKRSVFERRKST